MTPTNAFFLLLVLAGVGVGSALAAVVVISLYPKAKLLAGDLFKGLGWLGTWARKTSLADELEGSINLFVRAYNADSASFVLPECDVRWVTAKNHVQTVTPGTTIVRVAFNRDRDTTFHDAVSTFVKQAFLPRARTYLRESTEKGIDLILTRNVLRDAHRSALSVFNERFTSEPVDARNTYYELEDIDDSGLFKRILLQEYQLFGELLGARAPRSEHAKEADDFLSWLHDLAMRESEERTVLHFDRTHIRAGVVLIASLNTFEQHGVDPYLRRCMTYAARQYRTVYLLSRGYRRGKVTKRIAALLEETGGFEQLTRAVDIRLRNDDPEKADTICCIPFKVDQVALIQTAWARLTQAYSTQASVTALVQAVDRDSLSADVYGLTVEIQASDLTDLPITDARRYFRPGDELVVRVKRIDAGKDELVLSNVGSETDPKKIVEAFPLNEAQTVDAKVIGFATDGDYETAIRLELEGSPIRGFLPRRGATFGRFVVLHERFPLDSHLQAKVLRFAPEFNTWLCELPDRTDPWSLELPFEEGKVYTVVVREISENYVTCELAEGIEGIVYGTELAWGTDRERVEALNALSVGATISALLTKLESHRRRALLSVKRTQASQTCGLFNELGGSCFEVEVATLRPTGVLVKLPTMEEARGFLPASEIFAGIYQPPESLLRVGDLLLVAPVEYNTDFDTVVVSGRKALRNDFAKIAEAISVGDAVSATVRYVGESLVFVELEVEALRCPGFVHKSQVSNLMFVGQSELRAIFTPGAPWTFSVRRFDEARALIEVERRSWLRAQHSVLAYGETFPVEVVDNTSSTKGGRFVYGDKLEAWAPNGVEADGSTVEVHVARRGASVRNTEVAV